MSKCEWLSLGHKCPVRAAFVSSQPEEFLFVSDVTFAEIRFGIEQAPYPERRAVVSDWLAHTLRPLFAGRALTLTGNVILRWRMMLEAGWRRGQNFGQLDLFIAATAAVANLIVVSRDDAFRGRRRPHSTPRPVGILRGPVKNIRLVT